MNRTVKHLPHCHRSGAEQMAIDDAMLDSAAVVGIASFRFYDWAEPTLSLGYFQPSAARLHNPALAALPWLRRATGGDAILHGDGDLTYSLALPAAADWHDGEPWLCRMHHLIVRVLRHQGITARTIVCGEEARHGPALCFVHHTAGDIVIDGVKVVGSAQRRQRGALLQHGTIRLRQSPYTPQLPGIHELTGIAISPTVLMTTITAELASDTGWTWQPAELPTRDNSNRYATSEWNEKR
jgi:lipoyl(octanoyl) transferase